MNDTQPQVCAHCRIKEDPTDERHGTVNGYINLRCRCDKCRAAHTAYAAARRAAKVSEPATSG